MDKEYEKKKARRDKYRHIERDAATVSMRCSGCKETKLVSDFNEHMFNIRYPYCKECRRSATKIHHDKPDSKSKHRQWYNRTYRPKARNLHYQKKYGITLDQYNAMLDSQGGVCKICKRIETPKGRNIDSYLSVDHCHVSGKVRGILCRNCNAGLGSFQESHELLLIASQYLKDNS